MLSNSAGFHRKTAPTIKAKQLKLLPNERQFIPDRISGDISFHLYRSTFLTPQKYLEFLKNLEQSSSRHDFLFWVFDIVAAGRSADQRSISANDLNNIFGDPDFVYINKVIESATRGSIDGEVPCSNFSDYLLKTYPEIFKPHSYEDHQNPSFTTFPNTPELYEYRSKAFSSLTKEHFIRANHDEYFLINPMEGLTAEDFPPPAPEIHYEKLNPKKFNKHSFFSYYNYFHGLLTYIGQIPESTDCILVDKCPYKRLQVEAYLKKIGFDKLENVTSNEIQELSGNGSVVVVADDETDGDNIATGTSNNSYEYETLHFQRAKLLHAIPPPSEHSAYVLFVDSGKVAVVSVYQIFKYTFDTNAPEILTTIVPQKKLPKIPEEDDFFYYDFMQKKYFCVGCPSKKFNPAPDPLDELDTDTESVYFGKGAPPIDWEKENELIERPVLDDDDFESSEDDSDEEEDIVYGVQRIVANLGNEKKVESEEEEEGDDEAEEYQSDEEDMELY